MYKNEAMKYYNNILALLFFFFWLSPNGAAQKFVGEIKINDSEQTHLIYLKNGKVKEGQILAIENIELTFFSTENETTSTYQLSDLTKVMVKGAVEKSHEEYDELAYKGLNRLFYQETGFSLRAGTMEYTTCFGIIHNFDYAVSDGFTIGGGIIYPGYFTFHSKVNLADSKNSRRFRMGLDFSLAARSIRDANSDDEPLGWRGFMKVGLYTSYGFPDRNIHLAFNVSPIFTEGQTFGDAMIVSFNYGGTLRVAKHWRIIYENVFGAFDSNNAFFEGLFNGIGFSYFDQRNIVKFGVKPNANFGFFNVPLSDINTMHRLPYLSYSRNF